MWWEREVCGGWCVIGRPGTRPHRHHQHAPHDGRWAAHSWRYVLHNNWPWRLTHITCTLLILSDCILFFSFMDKRKIRSQYTVWSITSYCRANSRQLEGNTSWGVGARSCSLLSTCHDIFIILPTQARSLRSSSSCSRNITPRVWKLGKMTSVG